MSNKRLTETDLILNSDGSLYHLHLREEHIADKVIVVGDQGRVEQISKYFEKIELKIQNREFVTHTGLFNKHRITVMSTGIGTDNIDIAVNELDAAINIDHNTKQPKLQKRKLNIVRIGTSGALQEDIPVGSHVISEFGLGFDNLLHFYNYTPDETESLLTERINKHLDLSKNLSAPYVCRGSETLLKLLMEGMVKGITATAPGFYGPQGRQLRLPPKEENINDKLQSFSYKDHRITNFEMETSALYGLGNLLGHDCCTCCTIIANRIRNEYSKDYHKDVDRLITTVLERLTQ